MNSIKVKIIRIGNSKGIRLSKSLIEQYNMKDEVLLEAKRDSIIIRPVENPRVDWEKSMIRLLAAFWKHWPRCLRLDGIQAVKITSQKLPIIKAFRSFILLHLYPLAVL